MENNYKLLQVQDVFMEHYSYIILFGLSSSYTEGKEIWLYSSTNKYNLIRISSSNAQSFYLEEKKYTSLLNEAKKALGQELSVFHVFVNKDPYDQTLLEGNYLNIDENYIEGKELDYFSHLKNCIHEVSDIKKEMNRLNQNLKSIYQARKKRLLKANSKQLLPVNVLMYICLLVFVLSKLIANNYSEITSYIVLGGLYKTFTIGLGQVFRLITYAFVHGGLLHLLCNMYALYIVGQFICLRYNAKTFLFVLISSIFMGGITQTLLFENTVCVGMSAGIYGLFFVYIATVIQDRMANLQQLMPIILINLSLNFLSQTAWVAHLGGLVGGMVAYFIISKDKQERLGPIILYIVLIVSMLVKLYTVKQINPFYIGTDLQVVQFFKELGLKDYASSLSNRLYQIYSKFGG